MTAPILSAAAAELAALLRDEAGLLERDARLFNARGLPQFAGDVRELRRRLLRVLTTCESIAGRQDDGRSR